MCFNELRIQRHHLLFIKKKASREKLRPIKVKQKAKLIVDLTSAELRGRQYGMKIYAKYQFSYAQES